METNLIHFYKPRNWFYKKKRTKYLIDGEIFKNPYSLNFIENNIDDFLHLLTPIKSDSPFAIVQNNHSKYYLSLLFKNINAFDFCMKYKDFIFNINKQNKINTYNIFFNSLCENNNYNMLDFIQQFIINNKDHICLHPLSKLCNKPSQKAMDIISSEWHSLYNSKNLNNLLVNESIHSMELIQIVVDNFLKLYDNSNLGLINYYASDNDNNIDINFLYRNKNELLAPFIEKVTFSNYIKHHINTYITAICEYPFLTPGMIDFIKKIYYSTNGINSHNSLSFYTENNNTLDPFVRNIKNIIIYYLCLNENSCVIEILKEFGLKKIDKYSWIELSKHKSPDYYYLLRDNANLINLSNEYKSVHFNQIVCYCNNLLTITGRKEALEEFNFIKNVIHNENELYKEYKSALKKNYLEKLCINNNPLICEEIFDFLEQNDNLLFDNDTFSRTYVTNNLLNYFNDIFDYLKLLCSNFNTKALKFADKIIEKIIKICNKKNIYINNVIYQLCRNTNTYALKMVDKYAEYLNNEAWVILSKNSNQYAFVVIRNNIKYIKRNKDFWHSLHYNNNPEAIELLSDFKSKIIWQNIITNPNIFKLDYALMKESKRQLHKQLLMKYYYLDKQIYINKYLCNNILDYLW